MKEKDKKVFNPIQWMLVVWSVVLLLSVTAYFITQLSSDGTKIIQGPTYQIVSIILAFAGFVMTTFFSFLILAHNKTNKRESDAANLRSEQFRELSFASSNYSVIEFVEHMVMYEEYKRYTDRLKNTRDFAFYLRDKNINQNDILENFDNYTFLTIKIPFHVMEGKRVATVRIQHFLFTKNEQDYVFVPCAEDNRTMMLHDEVNKRSDISVNLIVEKNSEFYTAGKISEFTRMRIDLSMLSLLGVVVSGWMELYFANPQKREKDGASTYAINSSRFRISGLPELAYNPTQKVGG